MSFIIKNKDLQYYKDKIQKELTEPKTDKKLLAEYSYNLKHETDKNKIEEYKKLIEQENNNPRPHKHKLIKYKEEIERIIIAEEHKKVLIEKDNEKKAKDKFLNRYSMYIYNLFSYRKMKQLEEPIKDQFKYIYMIYTLMENYNYILEHKLDDRFIKYEDITPEQKEELERFITLYNKYYHKRNEIIETESNMNNFDMFNSFCEYEIKPDELI